MTTTTHPDPEGPPVDGPVADSPVLVLCDTTRAPARAVVGLNAPDRGVVAIDCPTGARHFGAVAHELFEALGQTSATTANRVRATRHQLPLLTISLLARGVRHVVVDDAQRLTPAVAVTLVHTCLAAGAALTAAHRGPTGAGLGVVLDAWPHHRRAWRTHRHHLTHTPPTTDPGSDQATGAGAGAGVGVGFPGRVPHDEFPRFLTACHAELPAADAATVTAEHHRVRDTAGRELDQRGRVRAEDTLAVARRVLRDATGPAHAVTICRASAAAAFTRGVLLTTDAEVLTAGLGTEAWYRARTRTGWDELWRYRRPEHPAAVVAAATGLDTEAITRLTGADLDRLTAAAPPAARPHLWRLELHRVTAGAGDRDPLLTLADGRPVTTRWVRETLLDAGRSTGLAATPARRAARDPDHLWARRLGITARLIT